MDLICEKCGAQVKQGEKFCRNCGEPVKAESAGVCPGCGSELKPGVKFCRKCGYSLESEKNTAKVSVISLAAKAAAGEYTVGLTENAGASLKTGAVLLNGVHSLGGGLIDIFKNKQWKKLIVAGIIALVWLTLMILNCAGVDPLPVKIMNLLTFSHGGAGRGVLGWIGGFIGKFTVASAVFSIAGGGYKNLGFGFRSLFGKRNFKISNLGPLFIGAGVSLSVYQYIAGVAAWGDVMPALSGALICTSALGAGGGFIYDLSSALTAKKTGSGKTAIGEKASAAVSGLTYGFTLGALVSFIPFGYLPIMIGGVCLIAGIVLSIVSGQRKEAAAV